MERVIVIGSSGHAKVVIDILLLMEGIQIVGVTSNSLAKGSLFLGFDVLGDDDVLPELYSNNSFDFLALGVGGYRDNERRKIIYNELVSKSFHFINVIHPSAIISNTAKLGEGNVIFPGVILNTDVEIGNNVIIATGSTVDHETIVKDHILISAGVTVGAYSTIEDSALLALGAKVISGVKVGQNALVAAGSVVVNDILADQKVFGIPAKPRN